MDEEQRTRFVVLRDGHVAELQLRRPDIHNRFDDELLEALGPALQEVNDDVDVRAIVFSSTGSTFSAGGDFEAMLSANEDLQVLLRQIDVGRRLFRTFADLSKPLIAAVHGDSYGVATSLLLTADAIVTAPAVRLSDPHVQIGLVAGDGGCVAWPAALSFTRAKRHLLWGQPITGEEAHALGMVSDLVAEPDEVRERALELAHEVAALPPVAVQLTKRALNTHLQSRINEVFDAGFYLEAISAGTDDLREAVTAFKERRPGRWTGK